MIADLDTLLTALYVELTDRIIPSRGFSRRGPGKPPEVTDAELVCLAVAQALLRFDDERHWLRAAAKQVGHLFPRLLRQSGYNDRLKALAPLMEAASRWLADATPGSAELLRLMDATPVPCGQSAVTARRSDLYGWQARQILTDQPANRPPPGTALVTDKGLSGEETESFFACPDPGLALIRPARKDEAEPRYFPNWLRQRVEAIIWTLKNQLGLERHGGRVPPACGPASCSGSWPSTPASGTTG